MSVISPPAADCVNLTFHGIGLPAHVVSPGEDAVWVSGELFTAVLDAVASRQDVRVSFDDGNRSDVEIALPALRERGLCGTFFVLAGRLGDPGYLSADDVRQLSASGMMIGSHGMRHRPWRTLGDTDLDEELVTARRILEDVLTRPVDQASIPFGSYDRRVLQGLRRAGYTHVFTSDSGPARRSAWLQARTSVRKHVDRDELEQILSPAFRARGATLRRAKLAVKRWR